MAALMTSVMENTSKITGYMETCKKMNIQVVAPDINEGFAYFDAKDECIIFGLAAIKNVGKNVVDRIVEEREKSGPFNSLTAFYNRMDSKDTNKRSIESLILAGAFDKLGGKRSQYLAVYKQIAEGISHHRKNNIEGQIDLFGMGQTEVVEDKDHLPDIPEFESKELLGYEKEVLGIYLSGHPLEKVREQLEGLTTIKSDDLLIKEGDDGEEEVEKNNIQDGKRVVVGGMITEKKIIFTKNNHKMAFVTLEDLRGTMEVVVFPNLYDQYVHFPEDSVFIIKGRISIKEETNVVILAEEINTLNNLQNPGIEQSHLLLRMDSSQRNPAMRDRLLEIFQRFRGTTPIIVEHREDGTRKTFPAKYNIKLGDDIVNQLTDILGKECVIIKK